MITLPGGNRMSAVRVHPKNWKTQAATCSTPWLAQYRFYAATGEVKLITIKGGVNRLKVPAERRALMRQLIEQEMTMLQAGYNPIRRQYDDDLNDLGTWQHAIDVVGGQLSLEETTRRDFDNRIRQVMKAAVPLGVAVMPVREVRLRHVLAVLEKAATSAYSFNKCRAYLGMVYKRLRQLEAIESNFIRDIDRKKVTRKLRDTLTAEQRAEVDAYLRRRHYPFWRFMHVFFQGFAREIELLAVRREDVDLSRQRFKVLDRKKKQPVEVWKTITDVALPLWEEIMAAASPGDYLFAYGFVPGRQQYKRAAVTQTWWKLVKRELGITADFYSLRHSATTDAVSQGAAVIQLTGHTTDKMIREVYDVEREAREHEARKGRARKF